MGQGCNLPLAEWPGSFTCCSYQRSKTRKRFKERFLIGRNRTKWANFWGSPLFNVCTTEKQKNKQFNLSCVSWMWEAGRRKQACDWLFESFFQNAGSQLCFRLFCFHQHVNESKWQGCDASGRRKLGNFVLLLCCATRYSLIQRFSPKTEWRFEQACVYNAARNPVKTFLEE